MIERRRLRGRGVNDINMEELLILRLKPIDEERGIQITEHLSLVLAESPIFNCDAIFAVITCILYMDNRRTYIESVYIRF